ncbi:MAG: GntR family transcriptional regulator [Lentisphaerae bacterium]|nr:GntR family transcriptional regulator [Lentisphaerota bacterium]
MYAKLFDRIIEGRYPPHTRLKEEELAKEFKISRTPVRAVLRQLEKDGLVKIVPNCGAIVIPFTADDVEDIYEIRKSLELLALEISAPFLSLQKLTEIRSEIIEISKSCDNRKYAEADAMLHGYIIQTSGRRYLISMLEQTLRLIQRFREIGFKDKDTRKRADKEHIALIDAICVRDIKAASDILSTHIQNSKSCILAHLLKKKQVIPYTKTAK